ncbi:NAD(P)/FAD-dependent oxidoreductase [Anaplasma marginale]|uniref:NAD(P)/FAD-dependent oxidoreductase n=1 Tax=Anaplasma marginale TaxID=770 RepID=UPI001239401B|nr:NAD(P)/FAD-dependent oxidoreductase [Anaplasma marginale]KAA8472493.1 NAD(P)/FAD-dependent oxidoreductase [Anaplasma marginale]KAB0450896.1 NAD(P)/FAD-dependent oxidoreductase [Anaplasma marginale]
MVGVKIHATSDVAIIGAGPVGLFTVFQAGMLGMSACVIDALSEVGGQCAVLYPEKPIYDIPAYPVTLARDLVNNLKRQADPFKPTYLLGHTAEQVLEEGEHFVVVTDKKVGVRCRAIVIAAGSGGFGPNRPPLDGITEYEDKSVFYHVSDVSRFRGKRVVIAGGGDAAADWAVSLSEVADSVHVIHRRHSFRCAPNTLRNLESLAERGQIKLLVPYQLAGLAGSDGMLNGVIIRNISSKEETRIDADFLLPFFGISAKLGPIANWGLGVESFYIPIDQSTCRTARTRIYAVGDVAHYQGKLKLILVGFSESALACHDIYKVLFPETPLNFQYSTSKKMPC